MNTDKKVKIKAYLTIYLALSLTVLVMVVMALLTGIKKNTIRTEEELALDTAGYSVLAEYDQELLRQYDLFFIDTSYGTDNPGPEKIGNHIKNYIHENLQGTKLFDSRVTDIDLREVEAAADGGGEVLKRQIAEYEENYFGIEILKDLLPDYELSEKEEIDTEKLIGERDENAAKLAAEKPPVRKVKREIYNEESGEVEIHEEEEEVPIEDPAAFVNELRKKGLLSLVIEDTSKISGKSVNEGEYISHRSDLMQGTGLLPERTENNSFFTESKEKIFLNAYIFQKYGYYGQEKENGALDYQVEYLIGKAGSDIENLRAVVRRLTMLREAANAVYLYGDPAKKAEISAMAASVSAVALAPYLQPLIETSILFAWACIESIQDVKLLLEGGKVPVLKTASSWQTDLDSILNFSGDSVSKENTAGLTYQQYLSVLLFTQKDENLLLPMMDVMEMDIRKTAYHENFRMDGCVSGFRIAAAFEDSSGNCSFLRAYYY